MAGQDDDDEPARLDLDYILVKDGEFRIDPVNGVEEQSEWLSRFEDFDFEISLAGVPVVKAPDHKSLRGDGSSYDPGCRDAIGARYEEDVALRLMRIFGEERLREPPAEEGRP